MKKLVAAIAATSLLLAVSGNAFAQGNKTGFGSQTTDQGQGNLGNENVKNNPGTVTETTTGPKGQLKNENYDCNNCDTSTSGPGNSSR